MWLAEVMSKIFLIPLLSQYALTLLASARVL